jgi:Ca2+-binding RTX toxin-like protein
VLIGGSGNDVFVFGLNAGNDRIGGFVDGEDLLDLVALGITDFANEVSITASGSSTVVGFDGGSVTLVGVTGTITEADFILA